jgi:phosphoribosylformylglycinamidine synthase
VAVGGAPPAIDLQREAALQRVLVEAAEAGLLRSAHDCSDGGLGVALAEACFGRADDERADGRQGSEALGSGLLLFGAAVELGPAAAGRVDLRLFGEAASRVVVSLPPESREALSALCEKHGLPASEIGVVSAGAESGDDAVLKVSCGEAPLFELEVREAYVAWATSLAEKLGRGKGRGKWDAA